ncbi:MAG: hypothetical protein ABIP06_09320 [Pyrinomonadaceae bacterium]
MFFSVGISAQKTETFDIISFKTPNGWQKEASQNAVQLGVEDSATGGTCLITMFKPLPGSSDSKVNFESAWEAVVKETVSVSGKPQMQLPMSENGWTAESGLAQYETGGRKGVVLLVTISGQDKMVNILILTNTDKFQQEIAAFLESVDLPKIKAVPVESKNNPIEITQPARKSDFQFSTSNFDDGWTSTEQEDWVLVTKGNTKVLIHYPNQAADKYNSVVLDGLKNAWDILVAPRYSSASNMQFRPITGWQSIEFAEAEMVEKGTGKAVYVVLFKMGYSNGCGRYLEFITANKSAFEEEFGEYQGKTYGWEKMEKMATYNKFAVAPSDLKGKWTNKFSRMIQYANIYTGADAGANTQASAENFEFGAGNTYKWDLGVASGMVGNIKFQSVKSSGKFAVPNNWQVTFSSIEGKPRTFNASFSAVKGARILWLDNTAFGKID